MDWPDKLQNFKRFSIMTQIFQAELSDIREPLRLLDFACGTSHYYGYLEECGLAKFVRYTGIDINPEAIEVAKEKYPNNTYICMDVLDGTDGIGIHDYITINGLFTQKIGMNDSQMQKFLIDILTALFPHLSKGIAFNAMSDQVDYKKDEAFHLELNWITKILVSRFSRNFIVRHDYGLYENTIFLLKSN